MAPSLKSQKEDFVSNLTGGTITEINLVTAVAPVSSSYPTNSRYQGTDDYVHISGNLHSFFCAAIPLAFLPRLWAPPVRRGLPLERRCDPTLYNTILKVSFTTKPSYPPPRNLPLRWYHSRASEVKTTRKTKT